MSKLLYIFSGAIQRLKFRKTCPCCGSEDAEVVTRKFFHSFSICRECGIGYRYPAEDETTMKNFYQKGYSQAGLTTDLPSDKELRALLKTGFKGSPKDFTHAIEFFKVLGINPGSDVLDFGANWGYTSYQFKQAGYRATSYEISQPRAEFGSKLGLKIESDLAAISKVFDVVFSSHVLEHVPDPAAALKAQMARTRPGGFVVGITPNGSRARLNTHPKEYNGHWGKVHPVLLTDEFVADIAKEHPYFIGSTIRFPSSLDWDRQGQTLADVTGAHLFFVIRC